MLSSLGRNGFVESLSAARQHRNVVLFNRRLRAGSYPLVSGSDIAHWQPSSRVDVFAGRLYTTATPPQATKSAQNDSKQHIPPVISPSRKPKIELRPGPVKVSKATHTPTEPAAASPKPASTKANPEPLSPSASPDSTSKFAKATEHDFEEASKHGILAPPPEGAGMIRRLIHQGKEFFKFYWRGLKLIESNRRRAKAIRERVKTGGRPLTRWETRFIRTNKEDLLKLIPFALIILIIEEIIPLVVLYAPFILPSTCILPSQKDRIDAKRRLKQKEYTVKDRRTFELVRQRIEADSSVPVENLLDSSALAAFNGSLALPTWGPAPLLLRRLKRHLAAIAEDDALLTREDSGRWLTEAQLRDALEERGIVTEGVPQKLWQTRLEWWLSHADTAQAAEPDAWRRRVPLVAKIGTGKF
ncbi:predicted protein [Sparassis crispa]|uniref:Letm1 RBD domain-containing protein n=1 Tax=Sparassis crispa TaxID=139825 RepID=A0A401GGS0_9APHY|nr:predicted protein [Sparassis crispa]GBE81380.1 predicted protein [Sparassis crispa]